MRTLSVSTIVCSSLLSVLLAAPTHAQAPAAPELSVADSPSPELIGAMTKELGVTPKQAVGGSGALLGLAKARLKPEEFSQVSGAIPGTDALLKAAPAAAAGVPGMGSMGGAAGLAGLAGGFKSLGLSPDMAAKMVPVMTKFLDGKGSASAAKLLAGALK